MDNLQGMRKHKIGRKKHKLVTSVVYAGRSAKPRRKYFQQKKKTYDHSPHEVNIIDSIGVMNDENQKQINYYMN